MKRYISKEVRCPFYHSEDSQMVCCEGVQDRTAIHLAFADKKDLLEYKRRMCNTEYESCMIFSMLEKKYEDK